MGKSALSDEGEARPAPLKVGRPKPRPIEPRDAIGPGDVRTSSTPVETPLFPDVSIPEKQTNSLTIVERLTAWVNTMNNPKTTWAGIIKIALGLLGTILTANSVTIVDGAVKMSPEMAIWLIVVAVLFTILSGLQAILTKDAERLPPNPL